MKIIKTFFILSILLVLFSCSVSDFNSTELVEELEQSENSLSGDRAIIRDLTITRVYVRTYNSSKIYYYADVKNLGNIALPLNKITVQGYIQRSGYADVPAGGRIIATSGYLQPGQTRRVYWSCSLRIDLTKITSYSYLKVKVDHSNSIPESNESNNQRLTWIPFYKPDLYPYGGKATVSSDKRKVNWSCSLRNLGMLTANTDRAVIQAWISPDRNLSSTDIPAGGYVMGPFGVKTISRNQTVGVKFGASVKPWYVPGKAAYLIIQIDRNNAVKESRENNNLVFIKIN